MPLFYRDNELRLGSEQHSVSLAALVNSGQTPLYVYDLSGMCQQLQELQASMEGQASVHYAMKANAHPFILKKFAEMGIGVDVVSAGEMRQALDAGFQAEKVIFSGVGKTLAEIEFALKESVGQINVESVSELKRIAQVAKNLACKAPVAFRFNPDVNPQTHPYITTGFRENKFGLAKAQLEEFISVIKEFPDVLDLRGLTLHIGSQLLEIESLREAIVKAVEVFSELRQEGFDLRTFDVGGGIGVDYQKGQPNKELVTSYGKMVLELLQPLDCQILCEPGRLLTACHGVLLGEVQYLKHNGHRHFAILNTGMHHIARPSLYQAYHRILPLKEAPSAKTLEYDIVGPICESSDVLGKARKLPELNEGDWLAIGEAGAYGMVMANRYNAHELPREQVYYQGQLLESSLN